MRETMNPIRTKMAGTVILRNSPFWSAKTYEVQQKDPNDLIGNKLANLIKFWSKRRQVGAIREVRVEVSRDNNTKLHLIVFKSI